MNKKTVSAVAIGVLLGAIGLATPAEASRCGGMPDGIVDPTPDTGTWDSPGEVISYYNVVLGIHSNEFPAPPGQTVKLLCAGAPAGG